MANNISIEGAKILFPNFSGKETQFNAAGDRNFCVIVPTKEMERMLIDDGWNVRYLKPLQEGESPVPYLQVKLSYKNRPPKVNLVTSGGITPLYEDTVGMLDWAEITNVDLIINPYNWSIGGRSGVKGYVKALYVTIAEDEFEKKYKNSTSDDLPF